MRSVCVIQSRLGSRRFRRKALADIAGHPMIWHVVARALQIRGVDDWIVATADGDGPTLQEAIGPDVEVVSFDVPDGDVLARYMLAARVLFADVVVRVTGDCPLLDPVESGDVLARLGMTDEAGRTFEYISNRRPGTDGLDTEAMTAQALHRADDEATSAYDREHVTSYIYGHPELFVGAYHFGRSIPNGEKWSVDTPEDLELVRQRMMVSA